MTVEPVRSWPDTVPAPNRTLALAILKWSAEWLLQPDGPNAGKPWQFTREQARIIARFYEIDDQGRFRFRRGVITRMKGAGKDPLLAALALCEACGPCRFGGWDGAGDPIVIQHPAPLVQIAAVTKEQTKTTSSLLAGMLSKEAIAEWGIDLGKEITYVRHGIGRIESVTSSPRALEGSRPSFCVLNETHHWLENNEGTRMAEVIRRNVGKSNDGSARSLEATNAHLPGEGSVAEINYEAWRTGTMTDVYYDSLSSPPVEDLSDERAVKDGLLAARGDAVWLDVDRLWAEINDPTTPEYLARRFYLNQITRAGSNWLPAGTWDQCCVPGATIPTEARVVLAFDGSFTKDATALAACSVPEGDELPVLEVAACWEKKPTDRPDWRVPIADVEEAIREACRRWTVIEIAADPYGWRASLEKLDAEGLPVVEFPQSPQRMTPATASFYQAVCDKKITHNGDPDLARHIQNCVLQVDSRGTRVLKDHKNSIRKIDLAVTAIMAYDRALALGQVVEEESQMIWSLRDMVAEIKAEEAERKASK